MEKARVCLNMIVRNEAPVIVRCLEAVRPFIDHWVVVDTGSTDGTMQLVRRALDGIPGMLHERPWVNFGHNRTEALSLAAGTSAYLLFVDADQTWSAPPGFGWPSLTADVYRIPCEAGTMTYGRDALVNARLDWRWEGVLHEYLACDGPISHGVIPGVRLIDAHDGARGRDPQTYRSDVAVLEAAVSADPDNSRNLFYLAQSYRDAGQFANSRNAYLRRAALGGWDEEVWCSLYEAARAGEKCGDPAADVSAAYLAAFQVRPRRAEPLVQLARYHRERGEYAIAFLYAHHAAALPRPADDLFVEEAVYAWRALDELAIAAYYAGAHGIGRAAIRTLLETATMPAADRERIRANAAFYGVPGNA